MGITARGAWESVKRHFRELGVNIQEEDFTVAGIGDMSGDVFGNGMLLSRHIRLVAAFDHRHIFVDPNPDSETGYAERERLYDKSRSTWDDYDRDLISEGGGVWSRDAKSIGLSPQVQEALAIEAGTLTPDELVNAILRAPVDLLFNGGIGTFVKASSESHADVGDKSTDRTRVDANALRCKVIGEGGNLGLTQLGRIEFALHGGKINTDAIDNSAGVDCSDHEVNIKILLDAMVKSGDLTVEERNELLADMTEEVAELVLQHNYAQTQAVTNSMANAASMVDVHRRYVDQLEQGGHLDRALEFLPDDERTDRPPGGWTRPDPTGVCRPVGVHQNRCLRRAARLRPPRGPLVAAAAGGLLPVTAAQVHRTDARASSAARDRGHTSGQHDDQRRRHHLPVPACW